MKKLILGVSLLIMGTNAFADYSVRYSSNYGRFDRVFSESYSSYSESTTITRDCGFRTCIDSYTTTTEVHIEETVMTSGSYDGYTRVSVYGDDSYSNRQVDYYTHNGNVVYREYHGYHPRYHSHYGHHYRHGLYSSYDFSNLSTEMQLILVGTEFVIAGADIATDCAIYSDPESATACYVIAGVVAGAGFASSISASIYAATRESDLQKAIQASKSIQDDQDLFSSFED